MILLEKSLLVLDEGVLEGRRVFANIVNYVRSDATYVIGVNTKGLRQKGQLEPTLKQLEDGGISDGGADEHRRRPFARDCPQNHARRASA